MKKWNVFEDIDGSWYVRCEDDSLVADHGLTEFEARAIATARENAERVERAQGLLADWLTVRTPNEGIDVERRTRVFLAETALDTETGDG